MSIRHEMNKYFHFQGEARERECPSQIIAHLKEEYTTEEVLILVADFLNCLDAVEQIEEDAKNRFNVDRPSIT